ncbi:2-oxoacid ferredoxin oxidoreductase [Pseudomonas floridensis]|uniref:2-oxoacid ferredoxin oxidoreductase n=1 Tax=Pseudomonas floridensis TaxID=1958950 RepID=A0A1X0NDK3_9PSED|nr:2-oxoacid ferredoxin oxidoreductase [Pseudomonas floridensis]ORC62136.1 2-oxoacid ferredoxin oxidoreductase [Pseudomonas floridensis]
MKFSILVIAATVLAGCAAPSNSARSQGPLKVLSSSKQAAAVAQCIQVTWQSEAMFGTSSDVFMDKLSEGGFTVFTTETRYFADVRPKGTNTAVEFYAAQGDSQTGLRSAAIATCL